VIVDIADTGPGIPKANLAKIFDPFFTTKPVGKGTGLGLSICYGIINKMGGEISVDSVLGEGTTFHIRFPLLRPSRSADA
jgi:two-component system NtrC family sensor kinase